MDNILNTGSVSLARVLLIFYVLIASNFTENLMGKQLKTFFSENRIAQHLIAFIMILVLVIIIGNVDNMKRALVYSILGYVWFIFTTKLDIQWNIIILLGLLIVFLYESNMIEQEKRIIKDQSVSEEEIEEIIRHNNRVRTYTVIGIIIITLIGAFLYLTKKKEQYGGGQFNLATFLLY